MTRKAKPIVHGLPGWRRGCRCVECRAGRAKYDRGRTYAHPRNTQPKTIPDGCRCEITDCVRRVYSTKGPVPLCQMHYRAWRKHGFIGAGRPEDFETFVDRSAGPDGCHLWTGGINPKGYGVFHNRVASRVAYELAFGNVDPTVEVDHRCLRPACVNPRHLRLATSKQNKEHRSGAQANSISGIRGVRREGTKWLARVRHCGKDIRVGLYASPEEASEAARLKRIELFTHNDLDRMAV